MAFKKQNNYWTKRSKHGKDRIFKTAQDLWDTFVEYTKHVDRTPFYKYSTQVVDKEIVEVSIPCLRPYTIKEFCLFCGVNSDYLTDLRDQVAVGEKDYSRVIEMIYDTCYTQKFNGAAAGFLNANLISRDLGLADKQISENVNYNTDITADEAKEIAKGLESEY